MSPLETLAKACLELNVRAETALSIFDSYDAFLSVLDHKDKRAELARSQSHEDLRTSNAWKEVRELTRPFHDALVSLILKEVERLTTLTLDYGIF